MGAVTRDAFRIQEMQSVTWFPLLNLLRRNYPKGTWSFLKLAWCALPLVNFLMLFGYFGAGMIAEVIKGDRNPSRSIRKTAETSRLKVIKDGLGFATLLELVTAMEPPCLRPRRSTSEGTNE